MLYTNENIKKRLSLENRVKAVINILMYIILLPILIYNICIIVMSLIEPSKTPSMFGIKVYVIISGSMQPNINIGDMVVVLNNKNNDIKVGDVIAYSKNDSVITHRVTNIVKDVNGNISYKTKGDFNNAEDGFSVSENELEGKVIKVVPKLGKIAIIFQNKTMLVLLLVLLYIYILINLKKEKKLKLRHFKRIEYEKSK